MAVVKLLLLCLFPCLSLANTSWMSLHDPIPNPKAVITAGKARFTVLTERIIRMEWGNTVDAPTFGILNRNLPVPHFTSGKDPSGWTFVKTDSLSLLYNAASDVTFGENNLRVSFQLNGYTVTWKPQPTTESSVEGNLFGTFRTLDGNDGVNEPLNCIKNTQNNLHCTLGLISQRGYAIVDETYRPQFTNDDWPWVHTVNVTHPGTAQCSVDPSKRLACGGNTDDIGSMNCLDRGCCYVPKPSSGPYCYYSTSSYQDLYFFGHGHDYKLALKEFTTLSGRIPMPPRYAFGIFYSRYWAYNDIGQMEIVDNYEQRGIPLDVLVTDMDWHITFYREAYHGKKDMAGEQIGWTGFTWDKHLFPQPKLFLDWCKSRGLHNTLNLHPASGVQPWEEKFVEMAGAMGIKPSNSTYVPFVPTDKKFVENWFKIVLGERETEGIDFWWLDWQQGEDWIKLTGMNPTFWLNYLFFTNPYHWNGTAPALTRPLLMHRWGGLGNHRYQIGFSGDVVPSWVALKFQVFFTISATNVGFGYWSHDLGGHILPSPPELYTRWIQSGTFSPIFRTHCTKDADNFRRIWLYPPENYLIMRDFMRLRQALVPYIYTQSYNAYETGLSIIRGMYYDHPEESEAYTFMESQYMFGDELLVAPITAAVDNATGLVLKQIWIPEGMYVSWTSGEVVKGPRVVRRHFTLSEMPLFAKSGAIIPMWTGDVSPLGSAQEIPSSLKLMTFVGGIAASGSGKVYEDDGRTVKYTTGEGAMQTFMYTIEGNSLTFTISASTSPSVLGLASRSYQICLFGSWPASVVTIGAAAAQYTPLRGPVYKPNTWTYDGSALSTIVTTDALDLTMDHTVKVEFSASPVHAGLQTNFVGMTRRLLKMKQLLDDQWGIDTVFQEDYFALLNATEIGQLNSYMPEHTPQNLALFKAYSTAAVPEVQSIPKLHDDVRKKILAQLQNP